MQDDKGMIGEIISVSALDDIDDSTSLQVLLWTQRGEDQRVLKEKLDNIDEDKDFDLVGWNTQRYNNEGQK